MPPLAPLVDHKDGSRQRHAAAVMAAGVVKPQVAQQQQRQRSASFHGRGGAEQQQQRHLLLNQRPRTQPDLLAGVRGQSFRRAADGGTVQGTGEARPAPSRVLLTVAVRQSMWPLHVMARTEWRVADLVAAAVELYVREGRRPLLPSADPAAFGLHFSQFSLQSLGPEEKLMELGSRSFFLCPKTAATAAAAAAAAAADAPTVSSGEDDYDDAGLSREGEANCGRKPNVLPPWLEFIHFWPLL